MTIPHVRKRVKRPKTRTGCLTCRERRIKCDETRPDCRRCQASKRQCPGYEKESSASDLVKVKTSGSFASLASAIAINRLKVNLSTAEGSALDFFRRLTVNHLPCGTNADAIGWETFAIELSYQHGCIAHAVAGLASMHRAIASSSNDTTDPQHELARHQETMAQEQYGKAIAQAHLYVSSLVARGRLSNDEMVVVLTLSLLLFCLEAFAGRDANALVHLRNGLRVIYERSPYRSTLPSSEERRVVVLPTDARNPLDVLVQTYVHLDSDMDLAGFDDPYLFPVCARPMPEAFSTAKEACAYLECLTSSCCELYDDIWSYTEDGMYDESDDGSDVDDDEVYCLVRATMRTQPLPAELEERLAAVRAELCAWMSAFAVMPVTTLNRPAHNTGSISFFCVWIWVEMWRDERATLADRFEEQYEHMTNLCEDFINSHSVKQDHFGVFPGSTDSTSPSSKRDLQHGTPPIFSIGTGVVSCLVAVATHARTSSIRRRCIAALEKVNLRGVSNSAYIAAYLRAVVDGEEQRARRIQGFSARHSSFNDYEIPEEARFLEVIMLPSFHEGDFDFYKSDRVSMMYIVGGNDKVFRVERQDVKIDRKQGDAIT